MTREDLLKDEWIKENFGDACYPNYLEPNFEAGVEYGERKIIEKACMWLEDSLINYWSGVNADSSNFIKDFKKAMEGEV